MNTHHLDFTIYISVYLLHHTSIPQTSTLFLYVFRSKFQTLAYHLLNTSCMSLTRVQYLHFSSFQMKCANLQCTTQGGLINVILCIVITPDTLAVYHSMFCWNSQPYRPISGIETKITNSLMNGTEWLSQNVCLPTTKKWLLKFSSFKADHKCNFSLFQNPPWGIFHSMQLQTDICRIIP